MDVSADLTEFARSPVAVICAGAKSVSSTSLLKLVQRRRKGLPDRFLVPGVAQMQNRAGA